jgi:hypothetical protein
MAVLVVMVLSATTISIPPTKPESLSMAKFICNQPITVRYALKAESKKGEKHGDRSECLIALSTAAAAVGKQLKSQII